MNQNFLYLSDVFSAIFWLKNINTALRDQNKVSPSQVLKCNELKYGSCNRNKSYRDEILRETGAISPPVNTISQRSMKMVACYESLTGLQLKTGIALACDWKIKIGLVTRGLFSTEKSEANSRRISRLFMSPAVYVSS